MSTPGVGILQLRQRPYLGSAMCTKQGVSPIPFSPRAVSLKRLWLWKQGLGTGEWGQVHLTAQVKLKVNLWLHPLNDSLQSLRNSISLTNSLLHLSSLLLVKCIKRITSSSMKHMVKRPTIFFKRCPTNLNTS